MKTCTATMNIRIQSLALVAFAGALAGCGGGSGSGATDTGTPAAASTTSSTTVAYTPKNVDAGVPVTQSADTKGYHDLVVAANYGHRSDPFALTSEEAAYDRKQNTERVLSSMGSWRTEYEAPPEEDKTVAPEEVQPYRRLAGIVVGDSVLAIIDMGDGQQTQIIRPGQKIEGTEWTVVSINQDHAILHRGGNVAPHTISVRLETPPAGSMGGGGGFGGPPAGSAPGGGGMSTPGFNPNAGG